MLAAYNGNADLVQGLIDKGADVNRVNDRGQSPLAGVVFKGYDEIARMLIAHGADPNLGAPTALQTAQMFQKTQLLEAMGGAPSTDQGAPPPPTGAPNGTSCITYR